ncbi:hypothetical protein HV019_18720 [Escherichia coli]|uniref:hypothetical protein n=1 Tax=Shigella boydii TaxID=621 RepID=UPI000AB1D63D|nr:hypothetical protein [Shigella boydii]EFC6289700.1 hypothetical protein [Escherichia coli]EHX4646509.1 hypothetical protein [Shigella dysenteriae]EHX5641368.1 hypothetical protein [Shigella dysenteriae]EIH6589586.1 hypothetical protein [Shigella boydii]MBA8145166.1 hypothetical protein [Escherichia coli]
MHTNDRSLTMVDLFCCARATARLVSEAGSEELSRVIASDREVLTRVLMAGDEIQPREWLRADSGSDSLSARVVAGLGLVSCRQAFNSRLQIMARCKNT